ncbi:hypothetical protein ACJMK2_018710 [Sinanodonta woodiana]|uniref:Uncharacterized protein n=1 Tax=Sinanodonta woodiana TaxID=1069815 RepID=A0ABD3UI67_SINWO
MSYQFPEHYLSVSERLSHILDIVGYSREDRNKKVTTANEIEVYLNIANALRGRESTYIFGSRGEGSTGPGLQSDTDYLDEINTIKVVSNMSQSDPKMKNVLMVKDNHTHPGYLKLQPIRISPDCTPVPVYQYSDNDKICCIDSLYRTVLTNTSYHDHHNGIVSGPAVSITNNHKELSIDFVTALRCSLWPEEGYEWFLRRRLNGWPSPIQIENARKYD